MRVLLFLSLLVGFAVQIDAADAADAADEVDYQRDIRPLLVEKCAACHGALEQQSGLRLDAGMLIRKGSDAGPVIVPGKAAASLLIRKVTAKDSDERMPPEGEGEPLTAQQVQLLTTWINAGAAVPADEVIPADPRAHWAYQKPKRVPQPQPHDPRWAHPVDSFIAREHRRLGLNAVELADRHTLVRRAYLNVIGLPPTPKEIQRFLDDESPDAWDSLIDSLLAKPQYGERWGRHWMDVWRYSDWDGYKQQLRGSQRHIWRWRDWIVQSLNSDKAYDRMLVEMLAGDEIAPENPDILAATGFLARNYHTSNRNMWLDATVEHTSKALLGLTLNCARCHDHKYDPIPQTEYYQFRAIFEPHNVRTDRIPGQPNPMTDGLPRAFDAELTAKTFLFLAGNEKQPDKESPLEPAVPGILGGQFDIQAVELPASVYYPALRGFIEKEQLAAARNQLRVAERALAAATSQSSAEPGARGEQPKDASSDASRSAATHRLELEHEVAKLRLRSLQARQAADREKFFGSEPARQPKLAKAAATIERQLNVRQAELDVEQKQEALEAARSANATDAKKKPVAASKQLADAKKKLQTARAALKKTDSAYTQLGKEYPRTSTGRRLALARWIASTENPLTARVAVNHIWLRHFGSPLVDHVFDFGLRSPRPSHAELLDWLAVEFMENNWSTKHLHRLILTSRTWRLASFQRERERPNARAASSSGGNRAIDRDNRALWRMNVRRLDAEVIRDSVLAVSGQLDLTQGGADIDFRQGETSRRRSIYLRHAYEKQMTMLVLFDMASPNECYRRSESIIPQQALALSNSSLSLTQSRLLARWLWQSAANNADGDPQSLFIHSAFLQVLSRPVAPEELAACQQFLTDQTAVLSDPSQLTTFAGGSAPKLKPADDPHLRALENLIHVLMNHNDFVTVR